MKSLFISMLFFFGPVILMFVLRYFGLLLRLWLIYRRARRESDANIIDITPEKPHPPSKKFITIAILLGVGFAILAYQNIASAPDTHRQYTPAQVDKQGRVIPGRFK